ncbi:MAG: MarR family transcriptional regulator [Clostridia bacterium]|nr:MarR family transcriptional regulator [Clostridia bacterium]
MADKYDCLKLDNQLCFPLYACSKGVVNAYKPYLDEIGLTYTQYIAMMVLWECEEVTSKQLGQRLLLDSGTLTPVLKALESKGFIDRSRSKEDERNLIITLTEKGRALRDEAVKIPSKMAACSNIDPQDAAELYRILRKMMKNF